MTKETEIKTQISISGFNGSRSLMPNNIDEAYRIATAFSRSDFIPKEYRGNADNCFCAINLGMEIGLPPMRALQSIAVVNGKPSIYGDAQLALVRNSGKLTHFKEYYEGEEGKDSFAAVCEIKREGDDEITIEKFSITDAKKANSWGKVGPWTTHPKRMQRYKARAFALRDKFADVLLGLTHSVEEMQGEILDVTPPNSRSPFMLKKIESELDEETISSDQAFELQELAAKSNQDLTKICKIHGIDTIIQLPISKFEALKNKLGGGNENS